MSENKGIHDGHRARVRERFMKSGLDRFTDHQVIELLLYYGIPRKDTNEIAHKLLDTFGSFSAVFDAPAEALMGCGLSYNCAVMLKLIPSVCTRYYNDKFSGKSEDKEKSVVPDLKQLVLPYFIDGTEERLFVVLLDKKGNVVFKDTAVTGASFSSDVSAQKLLRLCVQHNLYFYNTLMQKIRDSLDAGTFAQFMETILWNQESEVRNQESTERFSADAIGKKLKAVYDSCLHSDI